MANNYINDEEFILKIKIRTDDIATAQNLALITQEMFDDLSDKSDTIDLSIKKVIIHRRI